MVYTIRVLRGMRQRSGGNREKKKSPTYTSIIDNMMITHWLVHPQHSKSFQKLTQFMCQALALSLPSRLSRAYSNTGFDTNSCHLVQFTGKGRVMCFIRMAKKMGERRCFKVPEFDSSERLLVTSVPLCVGTFVLCKARKRGKMKSDRKREMEIDPGEDSRQKEECGVGGEARTLDSTKE